MREIEFVEENFDEERKGSKNEEEEINFYKSYSKILSICLNATLGVFIFGYELGIYNTLQSYTEKKKKWNENEKAYYNGLINFSISLSATVGCSITYLLLKKLSHRHIFIFTDLISISGIIATCIDNVNFLIIGRILLGFSIGINSVLVPIYLNQISPKNISGKMGSYTQTMICLGILFSFLGSFILPENELVGENNSFNNNIWRILYLIPLFVCFLRIFLILFVYSFETPQYLIRIEKYEDSKISIGAIYKEEFVEKIFLEMKTEILNQKNIEFSSVFSNKMRKRLIIGILLNIFAQFSGINSVIFYSNQIFNDVSQSKIIVKYLTLIVGAINLISPIIAGNFVDTKGRKSILLFGEIVCTIMLFFLSFSSYNNYQVFSIIIIFIFVFGFGISFGIIIWIYIPEILPTIGCSICVAVNWFCVSLVALIFPYLVIQIKIYGVFMFFACCGIFGTAFIYVFVLESKGKTYNQMEFLYGSLKDDSNQLFFF